MPTCFGCVVFVWLGFLVFFLKIKREIRENMEYFCIGPKLRAQGNKVYDMMLLGSSSVYDPVGNFRNILKWNKNLIHFLINKDNNLCLWKG